MDIVYLVLGFVAFTGLVFGLTRLLNRTSRNDDATHGGGVHSDPTGGLGGPD
jgi:hypothetical protein